MKPEEILAMQAETTRLMEENTKLKAAAELAANSALKAASIHTRVKPHADALRKCASDMMAAGIGCDSKSGHGSMLNSMADQLEAQGILGKVPSVFDSYFYGSAEEKASSIAALAAAKDEVSSLTTKLSDATKTIAAAAAVTLTAAGASSDTKGQRTSLSATSQAVLKKLSLNAEGDAKLTIAQIDEACGKAGLRSQDSMALKLNLRASGMIA